MTGSESASTEHRRAKRVLAIGLVASTTLASVGLLYNRKSSTKAMIAPIPHSAEPAPTPCMEWQQHPDELPALTTTIKNIATTSIVAAGMAPGAAIAVGCGDETLASTEVGNDGLGQAISPNETEYDLASVTKMFTATAVMMLAQENKLQLDEPVATFVPEYKAGAKAAVTFQMLLEHRSGLPDPVYSKVTTGTSHPSQVWQNMYSWPLAHTPGSTYEYSNIGFDILFAAATKAAGEPLEHFMLNKLFAPLGMAHTTYYPSAANCAPTSPDHDMKAMRQCKPQDDLALALNGVGGHAGWFSTATDMATFEAMLADGGTYKGQQILTPESVAAMAQSQPDVDYGLGVRTNSTQFFSKLMGTEAFGHTGWNGNVVFVDPTTKLWSVMLMNGTFHHAAPEDASYNAYRAITDSFIGTTNQLASTQKP